MMVEEFTAVAMCPKCAAVAVHPFRLPRKRPPNHKPTTLIRTITEPDGTETEIHTFGSASGWFDPEWATVVRVCTCGTEWPQS